MLKPVLQATHHPTDKEFEYVYEVKSYGVVIARLTYTYQDGVVTIKDKWVTDIKYSVTTSRHTNIARRAFNAI